MLGEGEYRGQKLRALFSQWATLFTFATKLFSKSAPSLLPLPWFRGFLLFTLHWSAPSLPCPKSTLWMEPGWALEGCYLCHSAGKNLSLNSHWPPEKHLEYLKLWHYTIRIKNKFWHSASTRNIYFYAPHSLDQVALSDSVLNVFLPPITQKPFHRVPTLSPVSNTASAFGRGCLWSSRWTGSLRLERSQELNLWWSPTPNNSKQEKEEKDKLTTIDSILCNRYVCCYF